MKSDQSEVVIEVTTASRPTTPKASKVQIDEPLESSRSINTLLSGHDRSNMGNIPVTTSSFYRYRKKLEGDTAKVLDPDNPLLDKFQKALKEQLLRQVEALKDEIYEYETGAKKKNIERENLGVEAYEYQQIIRSQQTCLEKLVDDVTTITAARQEVEKELEEKAAVQKKERDTLTELEKQEIQFRNEIESMHLLISQMADWEKEVESNITVNKTISEKTKKDRLRLAEEKRKQDGIIYKLMTEIWRLEGELEHMDMQLRVKETEREELAQTVAIGNTNVEALHSEYQCLMHSWNSVLVAIANKDKSINCLKAELEKQNEKIKATVSEIEQVKKLAQKEMLQNENLTMLKMRAEMDIKCAKQLVSEEMGKQELMEKKMCELQAVIDQTEKDIQKVVNVNNGHKAALKVLLGEYDRLAAKKVNLEERMLAKLENIATDNKALMNIYLMLARQQDYNRLMEITVSECENKNSGVILETEMEKVETQQLDFALEELSKQQNELEKLADEYENESMKCDFYISKKQRVIDQVNFKLAKLLQNCNAATISPLEIKINSLDKSIVDIQDKIKEMQRFWLREQRNLVDLSEQRQVQIRDINLLRKQILILEQKNLRMNDEVEAHKKIEEHMLRNVHMMRSKLTKLCDNLCKKRGMKTLLDKGNEVVEQEYVSRLKDAELECLKIQADIAEIEDDKLNFSKELVELNREALEWEKKLILVKETKQNMVDEQSKNGELFTMKNEIHRMEIRYSQLRKAQDKLIQDLEHCVSRRDAIFSVAEARSRKAKAGSDNTRIIFSRKLDDMKNRIRQAENEVERFQKNIDSIENKMRRIGNQIANIEKDMNSMQEKMEEVNFEIEESETNRRMNVELLVLKQRKLNMYSDLSKNRTPYTIYRTEHALTTEFAKQKGLNTKLCIIMANLIADFPDFQTEFNRLLNTLKVPAFIMYT